VCTLCYAVFKRNSLQAGGFRAGTRRLQGSDGWVDRRNHQSDHVTTSFESLLVEWRMSGNLRVVQQAVERAIYQRRHDAMAAFIRVGEVEIQTGVLRQSLSGLDDGTVLAGHGPHDVVVLIVEAERSPAVSQFPRREGEVRRHA